MRVTILIDNIKDPEGKYLTEHGISIYFEADGLKWLFDVGASPNFGINARKMGIRITDIDFLILSHAHRDHTGGLEYFLRKNKKAKVIMAPLSSGKLFVNYRQEIQHDITINHQIIDDFADRFVFACSDIDLSSNVSLIRNIARIDPLPMANCLLFHSDGQVEQKDDLRHEIALSVRTKSGIVVFSGCSHLGILNILRAVSNTYQEEKIIAAIGGTHLIDNDWNSEFETIQQLSDMANTIAGNYPDMTLITGHCTGGQAKRVFSTILCDHFDVFYSGANYLFGSI
jgi:7,8-dihydropterin-6-yl-methyl-4-(beta-D-ribofuranosyl)aminobenzene 5'-phosphate synthase